MTAREFLKTIETIAGEEKLTEKSFLSFVTWSQIFEFAEAYHESETKELFSKEFKEKFGDSSKLNDSEQTTKED